METVNNTILMGSIKTSNITIPIMPEDLINQEASKMSSTK